MNARKHSDKSIKVDHTIDIVIAMGRLDYQEIHHISRKCATFTICAAAIAAVHMLRARPLNKKAAGRNSCAKNQTALINTYMQYIHA